MRHVLEGELFEGKRRTLEPGRIEIRKKASNYSVILSDAKRFRMVLNSV